MLTLQGGDSLVGGLPIIHITYQQYIANPSAYQDPDVIVHISGFPTAGNMPADYVGYDSNLNMEDIGNIATKAIAKVEPSDTALYLHEVGTGFINKDGNYCITDVQISVGGTITLGTNCHVVDGGISSNLTNLNCGNGSITVTGDGSKTWGQCLNELYNLIDFTKITANTTLNYATFYLKLNRIQSTSVTFSRYNHVSSGWDSTSLDLSSSLSSCHCYSLSGTFTSPTMNDITSNVFPNGMNMSIYY